MSEADDSTNAPTAGDAVEEALEPVDYVVTGVRYIGHHIEELRRHRVADGELTEPVVVPRGAVIQDLDLGIDYCTAIEEAGEWSRGDDVMTFTIDGERYLRTASDGDPEDNLSGLPEF